MSSSLPLENLAASANAFAAANGIQVEARSASDSSVSYQSAPISLLPNAYPKAAFEEAISLAPSFNLLVDRISRDPSFLFESLGGAVAEADPYTAKLLELYRKIYVEDSDNAAHAADRLGIHRSDYMLNGPAGNIKQVELNTIAASFAGLACQVANLHKYLVSRYSTETKTFLADNQKAVTGGVASDGAVPENPALVRLPAALNLATQRYKDRFSPTSSPVVLFVVQEGETNTVDQRMLEFRLFANHGVAVVRLSLKEINERVVCRTDGALILDNKQEIAVVYFRAGYAPTDYKGGDNGVEWQAREMLEASRATKAPSLGYHLAGTKKVQQELARPGVLERFFPNDEDQTAAMRKAFAGLYSLGDDAVEADYSAVRAVLSGGQGDYVLKPQREGGGYNFYGEQLLTKLKENVDAADETSLKLDRSLGEYILMERLFPPQQTAVLLRGGKVEGSGESVSELGCFGTLIVSAKGEAVLNEYAGFLLRTKFSNVDEGGVASGFATLSSPYLC